MERIILFHVVWVIVLLSRQWFINGFEVKPVLNFALDSDVDPQEIGLVH